MHSAMARDNAPSLLPDERITYELRQSRSFCRLCAAWRIFTIIDAIFGAKIST